MGGGGEGGKGRGSWEWGGPEGGDVAGGVKSGERP